MRRSPVWSQDISHATTLDDLPNNARKYVDALESMIKAPISAIGVGPGRDETIAVHDLLALLRSSLASRRCEPPHEQLAWLGLARAIWSSVGGAGACALPRVRG